jgi:hypothetical protein
VDSLQEHFSLKQFINWVSDTFRTKVPHFAMQEEVQNCWGLSEEDWEEEEEVEKRLVN